MRNSTLTLSGCVLLAALVAGMYASSVISAVRGSYSEEGEIFLFYVSSFHHIIVQVMAGVPSYEASSGVDTSGHQNTRHSTNLSCSSLGTRKVGSLVREQEEPGAFRAVNGTS